MERKTLNEKAKDARNIGFTADYHSYFREFHELPYTKEITEFAHGKEAWDALPGANVALIPVFEARCLATDAAIRYYIKQGITQVLSIAAGMDQRGIAITSEDPRVKYVETDISDLFKQKSALVDSVFIKYKLKNRGNLSFEIADAREPSQLEKALSHFDSSKPVIVVNEGLMAYYSEEENRIIATNIRQILKNYGGVWLTPDPSLNNTDRKIVLAYSPSQKQMEKKIHEKSGRSFDEKGFRDNQHAENFFAEQGFLVRKYGQEQLGFKLISLNKIDLGLKVKKQFAEDLKNHIKVWAMSLK